MNHEASISQMLLGSSESIVLREIFDIFRNFKCVNMRSLPKIIFRILAIYIIQNHLRGKDSMFEVFLRRVLYNLTYKKIIIDMSKISKDLYFSRKWEKMASNKDVHNGFPIYFSANGAEGVCEYVPLFHNSIIKKVRETAEKEYMELSNVKVVSTLYKTLNGKNLIPKKLFPSRNFTNLEKIVRNHLKYSELTNSFVNLGILIDGEPGLGKTSSVDYIATMNVCSEIIKVDMTNYLTANFQRIISDIFSSIGNRTTIILIDELDKYIDHSLTSNMNDIKRNKENKPINYHGLQLEFKKNLLYNILSFLENDTCPKGMIIIFCSNNFNTIFNDVDNTHFESLKKRFLHLTFNRCEKEEVSEYISFTNDKFKDNDWWIEENKLKELMKEIPDDVSMCYRDLSHLYIKAGYDTRMFIKLLSNPEYKYVPKELFIEKASENEPEGIDEKRELDHEPEGNDEKREPESKKSESEPESKKSEPKVINEKDESRELEEKEDKFNGVYENDEYEDENDGEYEDGEYDEDDHDEYMKRNPPKIDEGKPLQLNYEKLSVTEVKTEIKPIEPSTYSPVNSHVNINEGAIEGIRSYFRQVEQTKEKDKKCKIVFEMFKFMIKIYPTFKFNKVRQSRFAQTLLSKLDEFDHDELMNTFPEKESIFSTMRKLINSED
jgi:hypothetical protein